MGIFLTKKYNKSKLKSHLATPNHTINFFLSNKKLEIKFQSCKSINSKLILIDFNFDTNIF